MNKFFEKLEKEANKKYVIYVLATLAFFESVIFPIPVDILTFGLASVHPKKWIKFGTISTVWSVLGAVFGYFLGAYLFKSFGQHMIDFYGYQEQFNQVMNLFDRNTFIVVFTAAFTPIPFKVFTIAAGALRVAFLPFIIASILGRGLRFFLEVYFAKRFGKKATIHIMKKINIYLIVLAVIVSLYIIIF